MGLHTQTIGVHFRDHRALIGIANVKDDRILGSVLGLRFL